MEETGVFHAELRAFVEKRACEEGNDFPLEPVKLYRGIPRLYHRHNFDESYPKQQFSHWPALKKLAASKELFRSYQNIDLSGAKLCLFTWVIADGLGDYMAAMEALKILKERFPTLSISFVALVPKRAGTLPLPDCSDVHLIPYDQEYPVSMISETALCLLRAADLIVQMPTFYPHTVALMQRLEGGPKMELLGEYGFLESSWFHPRSGGYSMGLHGLEMGILTRRSELARFEDVENSHLRRLHNVDHRFYLAYLTTPIGGAVYLHALLKYLENDLKNIDLCVPSLGWFIQFVQQQRQADRPILEGNFGVQSLEVHYEAEVHRVSVGKSGKTVRILCPGRIAQRDFRTLLVCSEPFTAVRGDQSFSEAVCAEKLFFYDGRDHARYFLKDLAALAEHRLSDNLSSIEVIRGMRKTLLHQLPVPEGDWVEETFFEHKEAWTAIADQMGKALQDPAALKGFQKLSRIIQEEHSCNDFLCHLVQRGICHRQRPEIERVEQEELEAFTRGAQSHDQLICALKKII